MERRVKRRRNIRKIGCSVVDYAISNAKTWLKVMKIGNWIESDNNPVKVILKQEIMKKPNEEEFVDTEAEISDRNEKGNCK